MIFRDKTSLQKINVDIITFKMYIASLGEYYFSLSLITIGKKTKFKTVGGLLIALKIKGFSPNIYNFRDAYLQIPDHYIQCITIQE